jgi:hypothetical protein
VGTKGKLKKGSGGAKWKIVADLKMGKNVVYIRTVDRATGKTSAFKKINVLRK